MSRAGASLLNVRPHVVVMTVLFVAAAVVGIRLLPGENERIAMLKRDGNNREALRLLSSRFDRGNRRQNTLYHLQQLYEHFGDIEKSRKALEMRAALRPGDEYVLRKLAYFYKATQDQDAYIAALRRLLKIRYDFPACEQLIGILRRSGKYEDEQRAIEQCRARGYGYSRPDDLVRLAFMAAADGDLKMTADLLMSVDDWRKLRGERERIMLFEALLATNQPRQAWRRGARWLKSARDDALALALIDRLARKKRYKLAISLAGQVSKPGDSVSLKVAELMLNQDLMVAAKSFLNGWLQKTEFEGPGVFNRFLLSALDAEDFDLALAGAEKFGSGRLVQEDLAILAQAMRFVGNGEKFDSMLELLLPETLVGKPLLTAAIAIRDGRAKDGRQILKSMSTQALAEWQQLLRHQLNAEADKALAPKKRARRTKSRSRRRRRRTR